MINLNQLVILKTYKYFPLSSKIAEWEHLISGKYVRYRYVYNNYDNSRDEIEFLKGGKLGDTSFRKWAPQEWSVKLGISVLDNILNISGLSTSSIIYIDEYLIYTGDSIFIKKDYLDMFDDNRKIIEYFSIIENNWLLEQKRLQTEMYEVDNHLYYRVKDYLWVLFVAFCISIGGAFAELASLCLFPIVIVLELLYVLFRVIRRKQYIKEYKASHPNDKLANYICTNAFCYKNYID